MERWYSSHLIHTGGELLPIHSLKWNRNDVLTTCKAISLEIVSGLLHCAWAYSSCRPPCEHVFPTETEKMAVEGKSLALLLVSYFLLRKKFSLLKWTLNLDNCMCERSIAVETRFLLWQPGFPVWDVASWRTLLHLYLSFTSQSC